MELIPAIDLLDGKVVRLHQGRYDDVTLYDSDPPAVAERFERQGAKRLHVVDLDGAKLGTPSNVATIRAILSRTALAVQVGGGVRNADSVQEWLDAGAERVVLGTVLVKDPIAARAICERWPRRIIAAVDGRKGKVAVEGWTEESEIAVSDLAKEVDGWGLAALLYTNILRDGTKEGPDVAATAALQSHLQTTVIASGGIGALRHLTDLRDAGVRACVCGRALYAGEFDLTTAYELLGGATC